MIHRVLHLQYAQILTSALNEVFKEEGLYIIIEGISKLESVRKWFYKHLYTSAALLMLDIKSSVCVTTALSVWFLHSPQCTAAVCGKAT